MKVRFDSLGRKRLGMSEQDVQLRLYRRRRCLLLVMAGAAGLTLKLSATQTIKTGSKQ